MLTDMEYTYSIVLYKGIRHEDMKFKALSKEHQTEYSRDAKSIYHLGRTVKIQLGQDSMTENGVAHLKEVENNIKCLRLTPAWEQLNVAWREYAKVHHRSFFERIQGADYHQRQDGDGTDEEQGGLRMYLPCDDQSSSQGDENHDPQGDNLNGTNEEPLPPLNM